MTLLASGGENDEGWFVLTALWVLQSDHTSAMPQDSRPGTVNSCSGILLLPTVCASLTNAYQSVGRPSAVEVCQVELAQTIRVADTSILAILSLWTVKHMIENACPSGSQDKMPAVPLTSTGFTMPKGAPQQ